MHAAHHPDGRQPRQPDPSLRRDIIAGFLLLLLALITPVLALCVEAG